MERSLFRLSTALLLSSTRAAPSRAASCFQTTGSEYGLSLITPAGTGRAVLLNPYRRGWRMRSTTPWRLALCRCVSLRPVRGILQAPWDGVPRLEAFLALARLA